MKKILLITIALLALNPLKANPVDVNEAKALGEKFMSASLTLAHSAYSYRGEACYYIFNKGEEGFVIISADDFYRPIIGYSENGKFDIDNIPPALQDYLDGIVSARSVNRSTSSAAPDVAADWRMLEKTGKLVSRNGGKGVDYLVQTQWNQSYPYNYYCPEDPAGSGGHAIVGCLATSMAQLVSFWKYPVHGNGSHCYYHDDYGEICADFENTYYDWDHIANVVTASSPIEEIEAAAMISFHCGVSIDMGYGPDGSGGASAPIPDAMKNYFDFSDAIVQLRRDDFETETWKNMVREQFDMGWPMYYGGCDNGGCHAFICDGYDDYDMFHFNLGWGGSSDGWYIIDDAPYTNPADAMFNFVPQPVYDATPSAPTNLIVTPVSDTSLDAQISWTNPTTYLDGSPITEIDRAILMRNNQMVGEISGSLTPGGQLSMEDHVPYYDSYEYKVFVVSNGRNGKQVILRNVTYGPTCDWRVVMQTTDTDGWKGNHIAVYNLANTEIGQFTMTSSAPQAIHFDAPLGHVYFVWVSSDETVGNLSFSIKDSQNNTVFDFSGSSTDMNDGVFFDTNNTCGNTGVCEAPTDLQGEAFDDDVVLQWNGTLGDAYAICIYRDDVIYHMFVDNIQRYVDQTTDGIGHCYNVSFLCENGESEWSPMTCVEVGDDCDPARNLWFEMQNNGKPVITWDKPENHDNLSGYYIYRKCNDGDYQRIKNVSASKTEYKENTDLEYGNWYYYKVVACYQGIDCRSIPAQSMYGNEYFVKIYYSADGIDDIMAQSVEVYPNPAKEIIVIKAESIDNVMIYNSLGQKIYENTFNTDEVVINISEYDAGIYMVKVISDGKEVTRKISVIK